MKALAVVSCPESQQQDTRLSDLAGWMGVGTRTITIGDRPAMDRLATELGAGACVAISTETLAHLQALAGPDALQSLIGFCAKLLVFSVGGAPQHQNLLSSVTGGAVTGLTTSGDKPAFEVPASGRSFSRAFAGQSFTMSRPVPVFAVAGDNLDGRGAEQILLADGLPVFLRVERGSCELFVLALSDVPDINERLSKSHGVEEHYDQLVPLLIFLRHAFGEMCWHGGESTARLIIDDPLLTETYGFLDYRALHQSMRAAGYGTTIAFIPWNHWRTSKRKVAALFGRDTNLSICVHGCDHSNKEFEDLEPSSLQWKADTALRRMERHQDRTGLAFDRVMVFPQGRFASPAMSALRGSGYLAAVNTSPFPADAEARPLTIADFLRPAIMKFDAFPLFQRRYPRRLIDFAFDAFLGRPMLIVQHHDDFREGFRQLEEFVDGLHKIAPKLTWGSLSDQLMQACLIRSLSEHAREVRFFTTRFSYKSGTTGVAVLTFTKEEPHAAAIEDVVVDGKRVPFSVENGFLTFEHKPESGQPIEIEVVERPRAPAPSFKRAGVSHTVGVSLRRALSELRDNTLVRHPRLLTAATALATKMKATGSDEEERP
jgi:hypothetical protein